MAKNYFNRYVWLIDTINRHGHISLQEISRQWEMSALNEDGGPLAERTFHNLREAIEDTFGIEIKCDRSLGYYIANTEDLEGNSIREWLLESMSLNNLLNESKDMRGAILFEAIPSSKKWLPVIVNALRDHKAVELTYQSFSREEPHTFTAHPWCLKLFHQRWYMLARSEEYDYPRIYALDRIHEVRETKKALKVPAKFNAEEFFSNYFGVFVGRNCNPEIVELRVDAYQAKYMETLPLHPSQTVLSSDENYTVFRYFVVPTFDFKQEILSRGPDVEVLTPEWFRQEIMDDIAKMASRYMIPVTDDDGIPYIDDEDEWKYL